MKIKAGVVLQDLVDETWYMLGFVDALSCLLLGREAVVTSAHDSHDGKESLHNEGRAADFRTRDVPENQVRALRHLLRQHLDPRGYDTILEVDHLHVEHDPKEGEKLWSITTE